MAKQSSIPSWLAAVLPVPDAEAKRLTEICSGWVHLSHFLPELSEPEILRAIYLEITGKRRLIIISRLLSRWRTMRAARENKELWDVR
jgi:hypothetical protein